MKTRIYLFAILILLNGCVSLYKVDRHGPEPSFFKINEIAKDREVRITLKNGRKFIGNNLSINQENTRFFYYRSGMVKNIPTENIEKVTIIKRRGHGGKGFLLGFLAGGITGYLIGYSNEKRHCDEGDGVCFPGLAGLVKGLGMGLMAGGIGYAVGESFGSAELYRFPDSPFEVGTASGIGIEITTSDSQ